MERSSTKILAELRERGGAIDADLSGINFSELDLDGPEFLRCALRSARIPEIDLSNSTWNRCEIVGSEFLHVKLRDARFVGCKFFDGGQGGAAAFRFCTLRGARFEDCDLSTVSFVHCQLYEAEFINCRMRGTEFEKLSFSHQIGRVTLNAGGFRRCNLTDANLQRADLTSCVLEDCNLTEADLDSAILVDASLNGSNLSGASLHRADLSRTDLRGADLTGLRLYDLAEYGEMKISADQQHHVLQGIGITVFPID